MDITTKVDAVTKIGWNRIQEGSAQPPPKSVKIEITAKCNLRCKYCSLRTRDEQPKQNMSLEFFKSITTDMFLSGVDEIGVFYIGESFMAPRLLVDAIKWCKGLGFEWVFLTANATMAHSSVVEEVMAAGLDSLKWSANFGSRKQFTDITGAPGKVFERGLDNIKKAIQVRNNGGYKTIVSASSIASNGISGNGMELFLDDNIIPYVDRLYYLPMYQMGMLKSETTHIGEATPGNTGRIDEKTNKPNRSPLPCWSVFTEGHVRVDGNMSACCFGSDDKFDMGQLDGTNFMEVWNSQKFQDLRQAHIDTIRRGPQALESTPCNICVAYD